MSHHKTEGQGWSSLIFQTFNIISKIGIRILASDGTVVVIKNHKLDQLMLSNVNCFYSLSFSLASIFTSASLPHFSHHFFLPQLTSFQFSFFTSFSHLYSALSCQSVQLRYFVAHWTVNQAIVMLCQLFLTN